VPDTDQRLICMRIL